MDEKEFSLKDTLFSGQCFRVSENNGVYKVICGVGDNTRTISVRQDETDILRRDPFWSFFFDLDTDYSAMKQEFSSVSPIMKEACEYAPGIRILNQNPWEALCSFVVSQNNNIKRIMTIIETMCKTFGFVTSCGEYCFPTCDTLAGASDEKLRSTGLGFRAPYIINTAAAVAEGKIDFDYLKTAPVEEAAKVLMNVKGIGPKVADCALLFGCHRLDCFPVDVWMKRVMKTYFNGAGPDIFKRNAGVAQQYLFHWARTSGELK